MTVRVKILTEKYKKELPQRNLPKGSRLESIRQLAEHLKCAPGTAAKVIKNLTEEKLIVSTVGKGNFFLPQNKRRIRIGYAGPTPSPLMDPLLNDAAGGILDFLESAEEAETVIIQHRSLRNPRELHDIDGLLLVYSLVDPQTLETLHSLEIPTVLIGADGICESLLCSQVIPDFSTAMHQFVQQCDLDSYSRIVILQANHQNSQDTASQIGNFLQIAGTKVPVTFETLTAKGSSMAMLCSYDYMASLDKEKCKNDLFITISGYIARGMYQYGVKNSFLPDILSIDNLEGHGDMTDDTAFFTAVDRSMTRCFTEGAKLLISQLKYSDDCRTILKVPTELIIRKSINFSKHHKEKQL